VSLAASGNATYVRDLVVGDRPNVLRRNGYNGKRLPRKRCEFNLESHVLGSSFLRASEMRPSIKSLAPKDVCSTELTALSAAC